MNVHTGISAFSSLISLAWAIVAYTKVLRQSSNNPKRISYIGMVFHMVWRCGMISSRIVVIVMLATMLHQLTFVCVGGLLLLISFFLCAFQIFITHCTSFKRLLNTIRIKINLITHSSLQIQLFEKSFIGVVECCKRFFFPNFP